MKKVLLVIIAVSFLTSCAPRRARCYGKRCVETSVKKEKSLLNYRDS
ncbi:hypothetical protein [Flavobacterium sp.]